MSEYTVTAEQRDVIDDLVNTYPGDPTLIEYRHSVDSKGEDALMLGAPHPTDDTAEGVVYLAILKDGSHSPMIVENDIVEILMVPENLQWRNAEPVELV